jgi:hypothetical protein
MRNPRLGRLDLYRKGPSGESASPFIDVKIKELGDWRGKTFAKRAIHKTEP